MSGAPAENGAIQNLGEQTPPGLAFNSSISRNVVKLAKTVKDLRDGHLDVEAQVYNAGELGQLAERITAMAARFNSLFSKQE